MKYNRENRHAMKALVGVRRYDKAIQLILNLARENNEKLINYIKNLNIALPIPLS